MKRIILIFLGLFSLAYGQTSKTGAKTFFVNGLWMGTKLDSYFNSADSNAIYWRADSLVMAKYRGTARALSFRDDTSFLTNRFVRLQTGNLYRQDGKMWINDTIKTDGVLSALRVTANNTGSTPAINGQNTSTGRAGSFTAATGVGAYITNRSATNPALYVLQDSTSSIARFVNNFDLGVTIDTSGDVTISNRKSTFTGKIQLPTIAANRIYTLPDNSGVLALTSNVTDSSAALRASINTKLNISDTAAMLTNYPRKDGTRATGTWNISTTGSSGSVANALTIGAGLSGTSYNGSAAVTIANTGVLSNISGTDITVSGATGNVTIGNNSTLATVTARGNQTSAGVQLIQNGNVASSYGIIIKRNTDTAPLGYLIQTTNATGAANIFAVDVLGGVSTTGTYTGNLVNALTFGSGLNTGSFNNSAAATVSIATGGVTNAMLANSTISGTALGGTLPALTFGTYLTGGSYNGTGAVTLATNATALNTASTLIARDASGNFAAGTITGALSGNATTATTLQTARLINGVSFNGSADITVTATATNALTIGTDLSGSSYNGSAPVTINNTSTLATVTGRGATTTTAVTLNGGHTSISALLSGIQPASSTTNGTAATSILNVTGGKGGNTTGTTGQIAGAGSLVSLIAGAGGDAPAGSTNGNGGNVVIQSGVAGSGLGTSGSAGTISLNIGGTTALGIAANQAVTLSGALTGPSGAFSLGTVGGTIGSVKQLNVVNTNGAVGDFAGLNFGYYNNTTSFGYIGTVLTSAAVNSASDLVFGVKASNAATAPTEYGRLVVGGRWLLGTTTDDGSSRVQVSGAVTASGSVTANSLIKSGGTSSQFLMADGSVTTLAGGVASGTYTPTLTNGSTVTSSTANISQYSRVGNIVTVAGQMSITVGSTGANNMGISLPIASNLLAPADLSGTANSDSGNLLSNQVEGSATNDRAVFYFTASVTGTYLITYVFSYEVK